MTEREYIEHLLNRAEQHIAAVSEPGCRIDDLRISEWEGAKYSLSAHTMRDLCRLWIERDDARSFE